MSAKLLLSERDNIILVGNSASGESVAYSLRPESSVFIGSGESCAMRLLSDTIDPRHCMVRYHGGQILVTDWFSEAGTFVNDRRITEETCVAPDDLLRLGSTEVRLMTHQAISLQQNAADPRSPKVTLTAVEESTDSPEASAATFGNSDLKSMAETHLKSNDDSIAFPSRARLLVELAQAQDEIAFLRKELEIQLAGTSPSVMSLDQAHAGSDELSVLRAEVLQLQTELAERDALLNASCDRDRATNANYSEDDLTDSDSLVRRLESLLEELQTADRRAATLDDLLRSSSDEHRAEVDERERLENWVSEIEHRVTEREGTWQAERTRLEAKISELIELRKQADKSLSESLKSQAAGPTQKLVVELQQKYDKAIEQLEQSHVEIERLTKLVATQGISSDSAKRIRELEEIIRNREVETSQERACLARERAELDRARVELQRSPRSLDKADETDIRIQAFRAHLKGIHEQEQSSQRAAKAQSLASRIAHLWHRLDGDDR